MSPRAADFVIWENTRNACSEPVFASGHFAFSRPIAPLSCDGRAIATHPTRVRVIAAAKSLTRDMWADSLWIILTTLELKRMVESHRLPGDGQ